MKKSYVFLGAGGTGGHLFPAIALGESLQRHGYHPILLTDKRGAKHKDQCPFDILVLASGGIAGKNPIQLAKGVIKLGIGFVQSLYYHLRFQPICSVGFGGYPSIPPLLASKLFGKPIFIHESNAVIGRANRLLAKFADGIATSFEETHPKALLKTLKHQFIGTPTRPEISNLRLVTAYPKLGKNDKIQLLIFGGSLGAKVFSDKIPQAIDILPEALLKKLHIMQQVHASDIAKVHQTYTNLGLSFELKEFIYDMPYQMSKAHFVIARAGASTVHELTTLGRPSLLIPLPNSIDQHQLKNAQNLSTQGAAFLLEQKDLEPQKLAALLKTILTNPRTLQTMAGSAFSMGKGDSAAENFAHFIKQTITR